MSEASSWNPRRAAVLWLAMLAAVALCAAGSYEHAVLVPAWTQAPPSSLAVFHGPYGINPGRWWRVVHPPTLLLMVAAWVLLPRHPRRRFLAAAVLGYVCVLVATAAWFLPELLALTADPGAAIPPQEWKARAERWEAASLLRLAVMYVNAGLLAWAAAAGREGGG